MTGLALTIFGQGVANFFGVRILDGATYSAAPVTYSAFSAKLPGVTEHFGLFGRLVLNYGFLVYAAVILAVALHFFFKRTRTGLNLRAVGESPATADAAGVHVIRYKYLATCIGAGISGIGGLYYVLDYSQGIWATTGQMEAAGLAGCGTGDLYHLEAAERHLGSLPLRHAVLAVYVPAGMCWVSMWPAT